MNRFVLTSVLVLALAVAGTAQLSGSYTVDPSGSGPTNFTSMSAAVSALTAGVSAPVTISVKPATYTGLLVMTPIAGTSSVNTVSFICAGATPAIIDANGGAVGLFMFDGTSWVTFDNFKIQNYTKFALYMLGFSPGPGANHNTFNNCDFSSTSTGLYAAQLDYSDCNTFTNCMFDVGATTSSTTRAIYVNSADDNTFTSCKFAGGGYLMYHSNSSRNKFYKCEFDGKGSSNYLLFPINSNDSDNLWQNCFFHDCGASGRAVYGNLSQYGYMFWHNTVIVTTSDTAIYAGNCCAWSRCCSYRDNIVVNLGTGSCVKYGSNATTLDYNDFDYNCYYAPNTTKGVVEAENASFPFKPTSPVGALAAWKTYYNANKATILPGGTGAPTPAQAAWDLNSIEGDPGLVSMTKPYDIHLKSTSPLIDAGTTTYVAGTWVSWPATWTITDDFEGDPRGTLVDIGADEVAVRIAASGSPTPGGVVTFTLSSAQDGGLSYQCVSSLGNGPTPLGTRTLPFDLDALFNLSTSGALPTIFIKYNGVLDNTGSAKAALAIPQVAALKGTRIYTSFVTIKLSAPNGIQSISNAELIIIQ